LWNVIIVEEKDIFLEIADKEEIIKETIKEIVIVEIKTIITRIITIVIMEIRITIIKVMETKIIIISTMEIKEEEEIVDRITNV
jgi:hypothetical protein